MESTAGDSPSVSDYSSCDESELERYSSAASVLATASVSSSTSHHADLPDFPERIGIGTGRDGSEEFVVGSGEEQAECGGGIGRFEIQSGGSRPVEEVRCVIDGRAVGAGPERAIIEYRKRRNEIKVMKKLNGDFGVNGIFLDKEEVLLDPGESRLARYGHGDNGSTLKFSRHLRDGSSTASTSRPHYAFPLIEHPNKIDRVEVVGAKKKKGDVSLGERLLGGKEYTVYKLRVWSGKDQWEVERRYRDFFFLYQQLHNQFTSYGLLLPSPWSKVEHESRKFIGNTSASVIKDRITLIKDCLSSILKVRPPFGTPSSLIWFLSPTKDLCNSKLLNAVVPESLQKLREEVMYRDEKNTSDECTMAETLPLVVDILPTKTVRQFLERQGYTCAGCGKFLDAEKTLMQDFVSMLGWGGPRICEYTGKVFCTSCHTGESAVLPAKILHHWDFSLYPVSHSTKSYLDSIYGQPILSVGSVNPSLVSKVPVLLHVLTIRRKIGAMFPYGQCPFWSWLERELGSRKYLLKDDDYFAPRELVDLSKGAFAALPAKLESVSSKIAGHIMQQCSVCYDMGIPCAAREKCKATTVLIFPFEESDVVRCLSCGFVFHEICIDHLGGCMCGKLATLNSKVNLTGQQKKRDIEMDEFVVASSSSRKSTSSEGFISELLSKAVWIWPDKLWKSLIKTPTPVNTSPLSSL